MTSRFEDIETVWIPLPDGVKLAGRIWLPAGARDAPVPAVLEFLPYRRRDVTAARDATHYPRFAEMGIAGVRVDMRGSGDSEGLYDDEYSETELSDAEAVIAWIAAQDWCSGKVGMMGISWGGFNALQVSARRPAPLKATISVASTVDRFADDIHYKGGTQLSSQLYWSNQVLKRLALPPDSRVVGERWRDMWTERLEASAPPILTWLAHQRRDAYWRHGSICEDFAALTAPSLVVAGWGDGYRNTPWKAIRGLGAPSRALTGPWVHLYPGMADPGPRADFFAEAGRWWGRWLRDEKTDAEELPAHRLFISEAVRPDGDRARDPGRWVAVEESDPPARRLHLDAARRLAVDPGPQGRETVRTPLDCALEAGEYFTQAASVDLPRDQRRDDAVSLCFETAPLDAALDIAGEPVLRLRLASDAPSGQLVARLLDVHPDGVSHRVSLGVLNLTHRNGSAEPQPMTAGAAEIVTLRLDASGYRFRAGHRIRLALATSYFPYILPAPDPASLTLDLGGDAWLDLPTPKMRDIAVAEPAAGDVPVVFPRLSEAQARREVVRDAVSGRSALRIFGDSGLIEHPDHGMIWRDERISDWSIGPDDPCGFLGEECARSWRRRDGVEICVEARARLSATPTEWLVESGLSATEDDRAVFERRWRKRIPRDGM